MRRSAFTLIEVMVAIALTLLLAGLVFAVTASAADEAAIREAVQQTSAAMGMARAEAQQRGRVVEVQARESSPGQWELATLVWEDPPGHAEPESGSNGTKPEKVEVDALDLPAGVLVRIARPEVIDSVDFAANPGRQAAGEEAALVLAVFLPDGSGAMLALDLVASRGTGVRLSMNRWTGEVSSSAVVPPEDSGQGVPEEQP